MTLNFIWNSINIKEQKDYLENQIIEWINNDDQLSNKDLTVILKMEGPLDNILNGSIINESKNTICTFQSNAFLDPISINYITIKT